MPWQYAEGRIHIFLYPYTRTTQGLYPFLIVFIKFEQNHWRMQKIWRQTDVEHSEVIQLPNLRGSEEVRRKSPYREWSLKTGPQALLCFSKTDFFQWPAFQPILTRLWKDRTKQSKPVIVCFVWLRSLLPSHDNISASLHASALRMNETIRMQQGWYICYIILPEISCLQTAR